MKHINRRSLMTKFAVAIAAASFSHGSALMAEQRNKSTNHHIEIRRFKYSVKELKVRVGDTVTWTNLDIAPHTATAKDNSWDTGTLKYGEAKTLTITEGFAMDYICRFHPNMKARLAVIKDISMLQTVDL